MKNETQGRDEAFDLIKSMIPMKYDFQSSFLDCGMVIAKVKNKKNERRRKMKKLAVFTAIAILLAASGLAMAQGWGPGPGPGHSMGYGPRGFGPGDWGPGMGPGKWAPGLNLTAEQVQKMNSLRESHFKETLPLRNEIMTKELELRTLWSQPNPDQDKILAKQREINHLRAQIQEKSIRHRLEMRKILTPEQQAQWRAFGYGRGTGKGMHGGWGRSSGYCPRW